MDTTLKLWVYVDSTGQNDLPFPDSQQQAEMHDFQYSATRMGSVPALSGTLKYPRCLDDDWSDGHPFGDVYAVLNGEKYFVKSTPSSSKSNDSVMWSHEIQFESERARLDTVHMIDEFVNYNGIQNTRLLSNSTKFSFFGDVTEFAERLNQSMYLSGVGDSAVGTMPYPSQRDIDHLDALSGDGYYVVVDHGVTSDACLVSISNEVISSVIGKTWQLYGCGWYFDGKVIHIGDYKAAYEAVPTFTDSGGIVGARIDDGVLQPFMYGGDEAMLTVNRSNGTKAIYDYVTGLGSSDNIPFYYPNPTPAGTISLVTHPSQGSTLDSVISVTDEVKLSNLNGTLEYGLADTQESLPIRTKQTFDGKEAVDGKAYWITHPFNTITGNYDTAMVQSIIEFNVDEGYGDIFIDIPMFREWAGNRPSAVRSDGVRIYVEEDVLGTEIIRESELKDGNSYVTGKYTVTFYVPIYNDNPQVMGEWVTFHESSLRTTWAYQYHAWLNSSGTPCDVSSYGISIYDYGGLVIGDSFEVNVIKYVSPQQSLMPSLYRNTDGSRRFYPATNYPFSAPQGYSADTALGEVDNSGTIDNANYADHSTSQYYEFQNEYDGRRRREHIEEFGDIRPSINGMENSDGVRMDMVEDIEFDAGDDNGGTFSEGGDFSYNHPYFFVKLRKTDGIDQAHGFNLFSQAIESGDMKISFTSGDCASCEFTIGVDSSSKKNTVQVDANGDLVRDSDGNVVTSGVPQAEQNDTMNNSVWIALKKEKQTFGDIMPYHDNDTGVWLKPSACSSSSSDDGDTFVILNIRMPEAYVIAAEDELTRRIVKWMSENNSEKFTLSMKFSRCFIGDNQGIIPIVSESSKVLSEYNGIQTQMYVSSYQYQMQSSSPVPEITIGLAATVEEMASQKSAGGISDRAVSKIVENFDTLMLGHGKPMTRIIEQNNHNVSVDVRKGSENVVESDTEIGKHCVVIGAGDRNVTFVQNGYDGQYLKMSGGQPVWAEGGGGEQNVQSDWSEDDPDDPSYILNKPDLSEKMDKVSGASSGSLAAFGIGGQVVESQYSESDITSLASSVSSLYDTKMDIVQNPHGDMIALVNSSGHVVEGTLMEEDVTRLRSEKMDRDSDAVENDVAVFGSHGDAVDSGVGLSSLATASQVAGKMDKLSSPTSGRVLYTNGSGQAVAAGYSYSSVVRTNNNQSITSEKTFTKLQTFNGGMISTNGIRLGSGDDDVCISQYNDNGVNTFSIETYSSGDNVRVIGVGTPVSGSDAANKQYVDSSVESVDTGTVHLAGNETITGSKTFQADQAFSGNVSVGGNVGADSFVIALPDEIGIEFFAGRLSNDVILSMMGGDDEQDVLVSGIATPQHGNDAANKAYVDSSMPDMSAFARKASDENITGQWSLRDPVIYDPTFVDGNGVQDNNVRFEVYDEGTYAELWMHDADDNPIVLSGIGTPRSGVEGAGDAVNRQYVDDILGDIETLLAEI